MNCGYWPKTKSTSKFSNFWLEWKWTAGNFDFIQFVCSGRTHILPLSLTTLNNNSPTQKMLLWSENIVFLLILIITFFPITNNILLAQCCITDFLLNTYYSFFTSKPGYFSDNSGGDYLTYELTASGQISVKNDHG